MNVFEAAKQVNVKELARCLKIDLHHDKCCCLFHPENSASMHIYDNGFYCFGCQASGSGIDLAAKALDISVPEAAAWICHEFSISYDDGNHKRIYAKPIQRPPEVRLYADIQHFTIVMVNYLLRLEKWLNYAPKHLGDEPNILFFEAVTNHDRAEIITDILLFGTDSERAEVVIYHRKELEQYEQKVK